MSWELHRHDARHLSELLKPESVDLIATSPPYWEQRDYRDNGGSYPGQMGSEETPEEWLDDLVAATSDWISTVKRTGSIFVNLSDKMVDKHRLGLPWRYALRCIDELGLILRADIIWNKPNGLPESVTDRVRISHEYLFHFTRQGRYYAAIDEVREEHAEASIARAQPHRTPPGRTSREGGIHGQPANTFAVDQMCNPLGKTPGSVWTISSEPLQVPDHLGVDHFAAYPSELVRRIILGWTPNGYCTACGEARRAVVDKTFNQLRSEQHNSRFVRDLATEQNPRTDGLHGDRRTPGENVATITGYACACTPYTDHPGYTWIDDRDNERYVPVQREYHFAGWTPAPTTPATVADPFVGTGTTAAVAHHLGRHGIGTDLSNDYLHLAEWRCSSDHRLRDKVLERSDLPAAPKIDGQLDLFGTST